MEGFIVYLIGGVIFTFGVLVGNTSSTNDISSKQIIEASNLCISSEGLYKINSGNKHPIAYCKNNDVFVLEEKK